MLTEKRLHVENHTLITSNVYERFSYVGYYNITHPKSECMRNETKIESGGKHRHSCWQALSGLLQNEQIQSQA